MQSSVCGEDESLFSTSFVKVLCCYFEKSCDPGPYNLTKMLKLKSMFFIKNRILIFMKNHASTVPPPLSYLKSVQFLPFYLVVYNNICTTSSNFCKNFFRNVLIAQVLMLCLFFKDKPIHAYMDGDSRTRDELVLKTVSIILSYVTHRSTEEIYHIQIYQETLILLRSKSNISVR